MTRILLLGQDGQVGRELQRSSDSIRPIATSENLLPAKRPIKSRLAIDKLNRVFGIELPHWHIHLKRLLQELAAGNKA